MKAKICALALALAGVLYLKFFVNLESLISPFVSQEANEPVNGHLPVQP